VRKAALEGEVPDPSRPPEGCFFRTRCRYATEDCKCADMKLIPVDPNNPEGHRTTCIRHAELSLRGV
jgi:oligopeptide/dipeptide ABC transporter ATP-binding protein